MLLAEENPRGTFLIRPSEHNPNGFSLSVKDWEETRGYHVKHYKIKPLDNGGYYIATNQTFPSLPALVMAYSSEYLDIPFKRNFFSNKFPLQKMLWACVTCSRELVQSLNHKCGTWDPNSETNGKSIETKSN